MKISKDNFNYSNIVFLIKDIYIYIYQDFLSNNDKVSELHMHKILFIIYALFYSEFKEELFNPIFYAWKYGPVESNYRKYLNQKADISCLDIKIDLDLSMKEFLFRKIESLLKTNVWDLVEWTHSTNAYKIALENQTVINNNDIKKIKFNKKVNENYNVRNILGYQKPNDEFYTPKEPIINLINLLNIPKNKIIWCPFDTNNSEFVIQLRNFGYTVINSHINEGKDFYNYEPNEHYDLIISNPPFSKKRLLIERCEKLKKDFCLLYGTTIFSQSMGDTLNRCRFLFIQKSIKFTTINNSTKTFQCCWVMNKNFKYFNNKD